jgi:gamma-glutamyltranspeptidase/glutathione hydrolase
MIDSTARVASGHPETTRAAADVLADGGNAVDALIAAAWTSCVAEPVLCSPGGGGHALVRGFGRAPVVADFFTQTPRKPRLYGADFYPIHGNFGADLQEFHIGLASAAVPGLVAGLFELHARFATRPMAVLAEPAVALARSGFSLNDIQAEALRILEPIVRATDGGARAFGLPRADAPLPGAGDFLANPELAAFVEWIARAGPDAFYRGEIGLSIAVLSSEGGGHLTAADLSAYRVRWRRPMQWRLSGDTRVWSNPPPAFGGLMVALMTRALVARLAPEAPFGSAGHVAALTAAMRLSDAQRSELERPDCLASSRVLMQRFRLLDGRLRVHRGTTHIGVRDRRGNLAGMTVSNGEGCGHAVPDCGFMLNNMLGEEDLNRLGFHQWPRNRRLSSMMAPTLVERAGRCLLLGSGGSNRIRTAIAQVLCNAMHFEMPLIAAVEAPRLHLENDRLGVEPGWPEPTARWLERHHPGALRWPGRSLYFGGVHAVADDAQAADPRRGGSAWASA